MDEDLKMLIDFLELLIGLNEEEQNFLLQAALLLCEEETILN